MKVALLVILTALLVGTGLVVFKVIESPFKPDPNAELRDLLEVADSIELIGIFPTNNPYNGVPEGYDQLEPVNGGVITKRTQLSDSERDAVVDEFWNCIDAADHERGEADCFDPHHGLIVYKDGKRYDVIICFKCFSIRVSGGIAYDYLIGGTPREMDRILKPLPILPPDPNREPLRLEGEHEGN